MLIVIEIRCIIKLSSKKFTKEKLICQNSQTVSKKTLKN